MTFLDFEIDEKDLAAAKFIGETRRGLAAALLDAKQDDPKISQAEVARLINMDKATLSKALNGQSNMTLRTIAEIAWALKLLPVVHYEPIDADAPKRNHRGRHYTEARSSARTTVDWNNRSKPTSFVKNSSLGKQMSLENDC